MNTNANNYDELEIFLKKVKDIVDRGKLNVVTVNGCKFLCYANGDIYRICKGIPKLTENKLNHIAGYNHISCKNKNILRHRIIAYAFLNLDINNSKSFIDHVNRDKLNNHINNLRIVTNQQNLFNTNAKGYYWDKQRLSYRVSINLNKKTMYLGGF